MRGGQQPKMKRGEKRHIGGGLFTASTFEDGCHACDEISTPAADGSSATPGAADALRRGHGAEQMSVGVSV